jgi:O-antigen ligase
MVLMLLALRILAARSVDWRQVIVNNLALTLLLSFALISVAWSEFPFVSLKRWVRDLGSYLMILVVLTDVRPLEALQTLLRRFFYLMVPLSVILVKYFPELGRSYSSWTGAASYNGVTTGKNILGLICVLSLVFFLWDCIVRWPHRHTRETMRVLAVNLALLGMTMWLLRLANSAMSFLCALAGCSLILVSLSGWGRRHTHRLTLLIPSAMALYLLLEFGFGVTDLVVEALGRDSTLTGRTELWRQLLLVDINALLGAGYEGFWVGDRLEQLWAQFLWKPNQAHNGYLEMYLNLGLVGLCLLASLLIGTYRTVSGRLPTSRTFASLSIAMWTIFVMYNVTEGAVINGVVWFTLLLVGMKVPPSAVRRRAAVPLHTRRTFVRFPRTT